MGLKPMAAAFAAGAVLLAVPAAIADTSTAMADTSTIEEVFIIGSRDAARSLPGTGSVIGTQQIRIEAATDINQLLKTVPGVYIREEDGFGLRPNIGIRGATSERSSKITLMEDGVMIAPAPYSNPSAYYFPTISRMSDIEVLKGAPLLRHGPQTTGGVVNMVSTPLRDTAGGQLNLTMGEDGQLDLLANYGARHGDFSFLIETAQRQNDGFKDIDRSSAGSGYEIEDYVLKLGWQGDGQSLLFKGQYSEEVSDETYLGLTDIDFNADPDRRYGLSSIDEMNNHHSGFSLTYRNQLTDAVALTAIAYRNEFSRDWFKLSGGGSLVNAANNGDAQAQGVLDGSVDAFDLQYKHNARDYLSQGIDLNLDAELGNHSVAFGVRVHEDEMDRFQPSEIYNQVNGELEFVRFSAATGSDNRLEEAQALSLWAVDSWQLNPDLNLTLALRYEDVESSRRQFSDPDREQAPSERGNTSAEWLPGASFTYDLNDQWQVLAGVHRGFSPLGGGAQEDEDPETSVNYEAGLRYRGDWFVEAVAFYSDFDNKTENCSNANPCSNGATSGAFITGEAVISGMELQLGTQFSVGSLQMPLEFMYTYTDAEISSDNPTEGFATGDQLAAVPENTFSLRVGVETELGWNNYAIAKYIDEMCVNIGCNNNGDRLGRTEDLFVLDFVSRYAVRDGVQLFLRVENLLDEQAIVSRQPDGARPNRPRTALLGVQWAY